MNKIDCVWISAAALTYEACLDNDNWGLEDIYFSQQEIVNLAEELIGTNVPNALVNQHACAYSNSTNRNCMYLVIKDAKRRLSYTGEFFGKTERPNLAEIEENFVINTKYGEIDIETLVTFIDEIYSPKMKKLLDEYFAKYDLGSVFDYLVEYEGKHYISIEKAGSQASVMQKYKELGTAARNCVKGFSEEIKSCMPRYEKTDVSNWINQGQNTDEYIWAQLRLKSKESFPTSLSVFFERMNIDNEERKYELRVSIEAQDSKCGKDAEKYYKHARLLEIEKKPGLEYYVGGSKPGELCISNQSPAEILEEIHNSKNKKVQICKVMPEADVRSKSPYEVYQFMIQAAYELEPYYNAAVADDKVVVWWPSLDEYDPGITVEKWIELLNDSSVTWDVNLRMFMMMLECGGESTCANLAEVYGGNAGAYNAWGSTFCDRVHKATKCPLCADGDKERVYTIAFVGRNVMEKGHDRYSWKLRDELKEALESDMINKKGIEQLKEFKAGFKQVQYAQNMILYGPPGTGKTYNSAIYAVAICDGKKVEELIDYDAVMARYEELKVEGRIAFTTFHQSYGYEEFIEGIAPVIDLDVAASDVMYKYKDGVFKEFCKKAAGTASTRKLNQITNANPSVWKVSLKNAGDNEVRTECLENGHIRIGWDEYGEDISAITEYAMGGKNILDAFMNKMQIGDIVVSCYSQTTVDAIGVITGEPEWGTYGDYNRVRNVEWIIKGINEDITVINKGKQLSDSTIHGLDMSESDIASFIEKIENAQSQKPYVFVIDEINRGNISKIFGELITLIESTKRAGMPEAIEAKLPYTQKPFSVPANVYILGTMNTADRSIALMDTALRRRFQFIEMMPETDVLRKIGADKVEDLDVAAMLETINERITFLYDREHTIGHAFFTGLAEEPSVEKLASIFEKSVIPLLQEYFYEDYQKIQLVLGDNGKSNEAFKFIKDISVVAKNIFKGSIEDIVDLPEKKYEINKDAFNNIQSYIEII